MKLISTKVCKTSDIGVNNNLFGGTMLAWLDEAGAILACDLCHTLNMVTVMMDKVIFKEPTKVNNHIRIYGKASHVGRTSISLKLEARRYNYENFDETLVCSTEMVFVRIDDNGNPVPIEQSVRKTIKGSKS